MNNNFLEIQFPVDISFGSLGGPEYSTDIISTQSGLEQRNINWANFRKKFNIAPSIKDETQMNQLLHFFHLCQGRAFGFRFKDWSDYTGQREYIGTGNGKNTQYRLVKSYGNASKQINKDIVKPVINSVVIYCENSILQKNEYLVNYTKGIIKFETPPGNGIKIYADFEFDIPVRFDTDYLPITIEGSDIYGFGEIPLVEVKLPYKKNH